MRRHVPFALLLSAAACSHHPSPTRALESSEPVAPAPAKPAGKVRPARFAGTWYPADPKALKAVLDADLAHARPETGSAPVLAVVSPHAGIRFSGPVAGTAIGALRGQGIQRVFLIGPSHEMAYRGIALPPPDLTGYATPIGTLPIDRAAVGALRGEPGFTGPPAAHAREHSLELVAIFLADALPGVHIVPLVVGGLGTDADVRADAARLAPLLRPHDAVVVSSDFTHYGPNYHYIPFTSDVAAHLKSYADEATAALDAVDLAKFDQHLVSTRDDICGREGLRLLMALLPPGAHGERVAFDTSGREGGNYTNSVSYVGLVFHGKSPWKGGAGRGSGAFAQGPQVLDSGQQQLALGIARRSIASFLASGRRLDDKALDVPEKGALRRTLAAFVTLDRGRALRGCIGHILPVEPLWKDIRDNAIAAATRDPRFPPVTKAELHGLTIEVSVLTRPKTVPGADGFVPGPDGVIFSLAGHQAVYLPQVAPEQGWDRATTLDHLAEKAGLAASAWHSPGAEFRVFQAQVFGEPGTHPGKR